jgi:hypothetical protein
VRNDDSVDSGETTDIVDIIRDSISLDRFVDYAVLKRYTCIVVLCNVTGFSQLKYQFISFFKFSCHE